MGTWFGVIALALAIFVLLIRTFKPPQHPLMKKARVATLGLLILLPALWLLGIGHDFAAFSPPLKTSLIMVDFSSSSGPDLRALCRQLEDQPVAASERRIIIAFGNRCQLLFDGEVGEEAQDLYGKLEGFWLEPEARCRADLAQAYLMAQALARAKGLGEEEFQLALWSDGGFSLSALESALGDSLKGPTWVQANCSTKVPNSGGENVGVRFLLDKIDIGPSGQLREGASLEIEVQAVLERDRQVTLSWDVLDSTWSRTLNLAAGSSLQRLLLPWPQAQLEENALLTIQLDPKGGWDQNHRDNKASALLQLPNKLPRVLSWGMDLKAPTGPDTLKISNIQHLPRDLELADADILILNDFDLGGEDAVARRAFATRIKHWVRGGGTLLLSGGRKILALGSWQDSALAECSPLTSIPKRGRKILSALVDRSGSMSAGGRMPILRATLLQLFEKLAPEDELRILLFAAEVESSTWVGGQDSAEKLSRYLEKVRASGGTKLAPALDDALAREIAPEDTSQVLVLSDGRGSAALEEAALARWRRLAAANRHQVEVFCFDPQPGTSARLAGLVEARSGRYHELLNFEKLSLLFQDATQKDFVIESAWINPWGAGAAFQADLIRSESKGFEVQILATGQEDCPAVARWRFGLGTVATIPLDMGDADLRAKLFPASSGTDFFAFLNSLRTGPSKSTSSLSLHSKRRGATWWIELRSQANQESGPRKALTLNAHPRGTTKAASYNLEPQGFALWRSPELSSPPLSGLYQSPELKTSLWLPPTDLRDLEPKNHQNLTAAARLLSHHERSHAALPLWALLILGVFLGDLVLRMRGR